MDSSSTVRNNESKGCTSLTTNFYVRFEGFQFTVTRFLSSILKCQTANFKDTLEGKNCTEGVGEINRKDKQRHL